MNIDITPIDMNEDIKIIHAKKGIYKINLNALKKYLKLQNNTNINPYNLCVVKNDRYQRSIAVSTNELEEIFIKENKLESLKKTIRNYENERVLNIFNSTMTEVFDIAAFLVIGTFLFNLKLELVGKIIFAIISYLPTKHISLKIFGSRKENIKKRKELRKLKESFPDIKNQIILLEKELTELKSKSDFKKVSFNILSMEIDLITNKPIIEYIEGNKDKIIDDTIKIKEKPSIKDIDIEVTNINNITKVEIKEDCNINEYMKAIKKLNLEDINKNIFNNALFDTGMLNVIHKKIIYIVKKDNITYNIINDDEFLYIDEHIKHDNTNGKLYIDERIIRVNKHNKEYKISRLQHDNSLSTFYVKFYESEDPNRLYFKLDKIEALEAANLTLTNLSKIKNIETIVDFNLINEAINKKEHQKVLTKKV